MDSHRLLALQEWSDVSVAEVSPLDRLLNLAAVARLREVVFAALSRLRLVRFDRLRPDRAQLRTLLGLVHRARCTPFGRDHDFAGFINVPHLAFLPERIPERWGWLAIELAGRVLQCRVAGCKSCVSPNPHKRHDGNKYGSGEVSQEQALLHGEPPHASHHYPRRIPAYAGPDHLRV